jgi:hypothetical protein
MIPGQPIPTELDHAAERAQLRRAAAEASAAVAPGAGGAGSTEARSAAPALPPAPGPPPTDADMVGVVFIHGIGAQRAGETVLSWSRPIIRILSAWATERGLPSDPVIRSRVDLTGRTTPFIELGVPADPTAPEERPAQRWVLTEAWWASDVEAPGIGEMLRWLIWRGEARRIGSGILTGINAVDDARRGPATGVEVVRRRVRDAAERLLLLGSFLLLALVAVPVYALVKLLSGLPIPTVAQGISTAQLDWFLADWFGDVRVLLGDRAQAANIRSRVETTIEALREYGCGRVVVVGHSGGTIVAYMTLADLRPDLRVDALITHGQALGLAWRLGHFTGPLADFRPVDGDADELLRTGDRLVRPLPDRLRWDDFWSSHDPAPAGPLDDPVRCVTLPAASHLVVNRASLINDHGGYWDNEEGFVIPVMRAVETAGRGAAESRFFPGYRDDDPRIAARVDRVSRLSRFWLLWLLLTGTTLVAGLIAGDDGFPAFGSWILGLPGSLTTAPVPGSGPWPWIVGAVSAYVLSHATSRVGVGRWDEWDLESRARARTSRFVAPPAGSLVVQWTALLVAQLLVALVVAGSELRLPLLLGYLALLIVGWFPREWRRRLVPATPPPADA